MLALIHPPKKVELCWVSVVVPGLDGQFSSECEEQTDLARPNAAPVLGAKFTEARHLVLNIARMELRN